MAEEPGSGREDLDAQRIGAEAIGEPGNRRFRLLAVVDGQTKIVWLEKEQLRRLAQALEQVLDNLPETGPELGASSGLVSFDLDSRLQIRAGRMELGYDEQRDRLVILAHDIDAGENDDPAFACRITRGQARELSEEAETVVSAGRPLCSLCGRPIGPGPHVCAKQNGHFPHRLDEVQEDEE
jgi:uncharacterized repeat protein (TIGR03847 family)